jgi:hypothetical protein
MKEEPEIFDIVIAVNRLKDTLSRVEQKVDFLSKPLSEQLNRKYLTAIDAAKILKISPRTLAKIRAEGEVSFVKVRRKIIYAAVDLENYLQTHRKN